MLSCAYALRSDLSTTDRIGPANCLVHRRTSEVMLGQAAEASIPAGHEQTVLIHERVARGKSASLLILPLELPLLLSGPAQCMSIAESAASDLQSHTKLRTISMISSRMG